MENIHADLLPLVVDIDTLNPLEPNPRRGDVEAVKASYTRFGQRKPITANDRKGARTVTAGNHQLMAAKELGWTKIAVVWTEDEEEEMLAWAIADNRTGDLGYNDPEDLFEILNSLNDLDGTGYTEEDRDAMLSILEPTDLDTLAEEIGDVKDTDNHQVIRLVVPPQTYAIWKDKIKDYDGDEIACFESMLEV